jgi:hypothetical protein
MNNLIPVHIWGLSLPPGPRYLSVQLTELNNEPQRFKLPMVHESEMFSDFTATVVEINANIINEKGMPNVQILCLDPKLKTNSEKLVEYCKQVIQFAFFCSKTHIVICNLTGTGETHDDLSDFSLQIHTDLRKLTAQWSCHSTYVDLFEIIYPDHWSPTNQLNQNGQEKLARIITRSLLGISQDNFNF